jgi:hypothetical protein
MGTKYLGNKVNIGVIKCSKRVERGEKISGQ